MRFSMMPRYWLRTMSLRRVEDGRPSRTCAPTGRRTRSGTRRWMPPPATRTSSSGRRPSRGPSTGSRTTEQLNGSGPRRPGRRASHEPCEPFARTARRDRGWGRHGRGAGPRPGPSGPPGHARGARARGSWTSPTMSASREDHVQKMYEEGAKFILADRSAPCRRAWEAQLGKATFWTASEGSSMSTRTASGRGSPFGADRAEPGEAGSPGSSASTRSGTAIRRGPARTRSARRPRPQSGRSRPVAGRRVPRRTRATRCPRSRQARRENGQGCGGATSAVGGFLARGPSARRSGRRQGRDPVDPRTATAARQRRGVNTRDRAPA